MLLLVTFGARAPEARTFFAVPLQPALPVALGCVGAAAAETGAAPLALHLVDDDVEVEVEVVLESAETKDVELAWPSVVVVVVVASSEAKIRSNLRI